MLTKITVSNYLLISQLEVDFSTGFSVITGETGAGKSIILGVLSLILGGRVDSSAIGNSEKKTVVEGEFDISNYPLQEFFHENDLDYEPKNTHLRREITPAGKSRGFINDTPVSLALMKSFGEKLVDIHSQHENQQLIKPDYQLQFVDSFAKTRDVVAQFSNLFSEWKKLKNELQKEEENERRQRQEEDFLRFQYQELEEANLDQIDYERLQNELDVLENAENIILGLNKSMNLLSEEEMNVLSFLREVVKSAEGLNKYTSSFREITERMRSALIELEDIESELVQQVSLVESNPSKAEILRQQLDQINHLMHKHGIDNIADLMGIRNEIGSSLGAMDKSSEQISKLKEDISKMEKSLDQQSDEISTKRKTAIPELENKIHEGLTFLGMPNARIELELTDTTDYNKFGKNQVGVRFSANKGFILMPLEKVASGGERSRLMLVLKRILATLSATPTLILDEIDTGISGEVAAKTAQMLAEMSEFTQIISITHLPQVAGKAKNHLRVSKLVKGEKTETTLEVLNPEERKFEIARLLSGEEISEAALENAAQLMKK